MSSTSGLTDSVDPGTRRILFVNCLALAVCFVALVLNFVVAEAEGHDCKPWRVPSWGVSVAVIAIAGLASACLAAVNQVVQQRNQPLQIVGTGKPPDLTLPDGKSWHIFLSHTWKSGQDQVSVIKHQLKNVLPGVRVWLDVDELDDLGKLEEFVHGSATVLVFLSQVPARASLFPRARAVTLQRPSLSLARCCPADGRHARFAAITGLFSLQELPTGAPRRARRRAPGVLPAATTARPRRSSSGDGGTPLATTARHTCCPAPASPPVPAVASAVVPSQPRTLNRDARLHRTHACIVRSHPSRTHARTLMRLRVGQVPLLLVHELDSKRGGATFDEMQVLPPLPTGAGSLP
tara:strand:+ start:145 stop:1194 length:1050 start_codon:yes stop_codon:yes gene_type:complete